MRPVSIDTFCDLRFLSEVKLSPSGKLACFTVTQAEKESNGYRSCIYMKKGRKVSKLTSFGRESRFVFTGEDTVLFKSDREEKSGEDISSKFYEISLAGGEAELKYTLPIPVNTLIPLKNGSFIAVGTTFPGFEDLYKGDKRLLAEYLKHKKENEDYEEVTQNPWWHNGGPFTKNSYESLFLYDPRRGKLKRLTDIGEGVSDVKLGKDEKAVYYSAMDVTGQKLDFYTGETLCRIDLASGEKEELIKSRKDFRIKGYDLGESFILLRASDGKYGMNTDPDFYKLPYEGGEPELICTFGMTVGSSIGSDIRYGGGRATKMIGDTFYFLTTQFDSSYLWKLEDGKISPVVEREGSIDCFDMTGEDNILLTALWDMKGQELYDGTGKQITRFNEAALRNTYVAVPEKLNFTNGDHEVHGFVLKPIDYDPEKKYPVIIDIHGGPKAAFGPVFYHEMQYWTGLGYFVIYCNPTGSDGRGAYMNILGKYGTVDYEDIMAFCDAALAAWPQMDRENFFETGGSYGGFMTNWIVGHTDRFKATASQRSISNWVSFWGISDIGIDFAEDQNAASIWPDPEKLWWHSPLKYADRCKTPTLFIHSFEDYRCPIDQGYQMYSALVAHGVPAKMVLFKGENHELSRSGKPLHRIKRIDEITKWFEKYKGCETK